MKLISTHPLSYILVLVCLLTGPVIAEAQVTYTYPIRKFTLALDDTQARMAYMDVAPTAPANGKTVVLLHGKNFNGYYWKDVIPALAAKGFRVIVPDQVGWGRSDKPLIHYSFHGLAGNTAALLDTLNIQKIILIGHSMGGMLATRFAILYPGRVEKLILENPIGLEDYRRFVPYRATRLLIENERKATYESYKKYQQSYYPAWKPEYEQYVEPQSEALNDPNFRSIAQVNALTYQMIYEQPVCYEWNRLAMPVLLIIGQEDRTVVGKDQLTDAQKKLYGQYPALGKKTKQQIPNATLAELPGIGHIPHVQQIDLFLNRVFSFIK